MNASFRTAFWAMCLGLTVPMMLFVGVELTSGGKASSSRKGGGTTAASSLQSQWSGNGPATDGSLRKGDKPTRSVRRPVGPRTQANLGAIDSQPIFNGARLSPDLEPDIDPDRPMNSVEPAPWSDSVGSAMPLAGNVTLDPNLEPDSDLDEVPPAHLRHPAFPASTRPRSHSAPGQYVPGAQFPVSRIESQLDEILGYLERFSAASSARAPAATADPMQQAAELLIRLQQARRIQDLTGQILEPPPHDSSKGTSVTKPVPQDQKLIPAPQGTEVPLQPTPVPNSNDSARGPVIVPQSNRQPSGKAGDLKPAAASSEGQSPLPERRAPMAQPPIVRPGTMTKAKAPRRSVTTAGVGATPHGTAIRQTVATRTSTERPVEKVTRKPLPERAARRKGSTVVDGCDVSASSRVKSPFEVALIPQSGKAFTRSSAGAEADKSDEKQRVNSPFSGRRLPTNPE